MRFKPVDIHNIVLSNQNDILWQLQDVQPEGFQAKYGLNNTRPAKNRFLLSFI